MVSRSPACAATSVKRWSSWKSSSTIGRNPFLKLLLKKMSAKDGAMTARKPDCCSAHGACSREEPQPKFLRAMRIEAPW